MSKKLETNFFVLEIDDEGTRGAFRLQKSSTWYEFRSKLAAQTALLQLLLTEKVEELQPSHVREFSRMLDTHVPVKEQEVPQAAREAFSIIQSSFFGGRGH